LCLISSSNGSTRELERICLIVNAIRELGDIASFKGLCECQRVRKIAALNDLTPLLYEELHRMAKGYMKRENPGRTLQTTALVHETYLRFVGGFVSSTCETAIADKKKAWNSRFPQYPFGRIIQ
jgi:hypothetical protein